MTEEHNDQRQTATTGTPPADAADLGSLMGGPTPSRPAESSADRQARDLEERALAAARAALQGAQFAQATAAAHAAITQPHEPTQSRNVPSTSRRTRVWLRVMLVLNLVFMVVLFALPDPRTVAEPSPITPPKSRTESRTEPSNAPSQPPAPSPFVEAPRERAVEVPEREVFNHALQLANDGKFPQAIAVLVAYLDRNPGMIAPLKRTVLLTISFYHSRNNDLAAADRYSTMAQQLAARASLPDDLLAAAELAKSEGRMQDMRAAYARFLLQQRQVRGSLRRHVAEAYLQLADSWRSEAEQAQTKADADAHSQQQRVRDELQKEGVGK